MKKIYNLMFLMLLIFTAACNDWVTDLQPTNDLVLEDDMNKESNINFLVTGLHNRLSLQHQVWVTADGISDQLYFDLKVNGATYPSYQEIDIASEITDYNTETTSSFNNTQLLRMNADTLVWRCNEKITFTDNALKEYGLFWGYLYGGYARYTLGAYIGKDKTTGGATINAGPFIPSNTLFEQAVVKYKEALKHTTDAYLIRLVNSLIAKVYFIKGDYASAVSYLNLGLVSGDKAFTANYNTQGDNLYRTQVGEIRQQFAVANRFADYITAVPDEAKRIAIKKITYKNFTYYQQTKYVQNPLNQSISPIVVMDWQEVALMKAECTLRGTSAGDPMTLINSIRTSHGMTTLLTAAPALDDIYVERDKELFLRGQRLLDERRFNKPHIAGMWVYFPISQNEKDRNNNL